MKEKYLGKPNGQYYSSSRLIINIIYVLYWASLVAQRLKCLPATWRPRFDPWVRKIPGEGNGNPLHYSCLENPMDGGAWWATLVHGVAQSQTRLSDFTYHLSPLLNIIHNILIIVVKRMQELFLFQKTNSKINSKVQLKSLERRNIHLNWRTLKQVWIRTVRSDSYHFDNNYPLILLF